MNLNYFIPSEINMSNKFLMEFITSIQIFTNKILYEEITLEDKDFIDNVLCEYFYIFKKDKQFELSLPSLNSEKRLDQLLRDLHFDLQLIPRRVFYMRKQWRTNLVQCRIQHLIELLQQSFISLNMLTRCYLIYNLNRYSDDVLKFSAPVIEFDIFDYFWFSHPELIDNVWIPGKLITDCGYLNENKK